jgi:hypothetical protein
MPLNRVKCKSCGVEIVWMKTSAGKNMPVDAGSFADPNATIFDPKEMISHFATCIDAQKWRKNK